MDYNKNVHLCSRYPPDSVTHQSNLVDNLVANIFLVLFTPQFNILIEKNIFYDFAQY